MSRRQKSFPKNVFLVDLKNEYNRNLKNFRDNNAISVKSQNIQREKHYQMKRKLMNTATTITWIK